jgi:hypothetical protein
LAKLLATRCDDKILQQSWIQKRGRLAGKSPPKSRGSFLKRRLANNIDRPTDKRSEPYKTRFWDLFQHKLISFTSFSKFWEYKHACLLHSTPTLYWLIYLSEFGHFITTTCDALLFKYLHLLVGRFGLHFTLIFTLIKSACESRKYVHLGCQMVSCNQKSKFG